MIGTPSTGISQNMYVGYNWSLQCMFYHYYESMTYGKQHTRLPPFSTLLESMQIQTWVPPSLPRDYFNEMDQVPKTDGDPQTEGHKNNAVWMVNKASHDGLLALGKQMGWNITCFLINIGPGNEAIMEVPKMADGNEHCLIWQCKGSCMKGCDCTESHRALTNDELDALTAFLEDGCKKVSH